MTTHHSLSDADVDAIEARADAATAGPWKEWATNDDPSVVYFEDGAAFHIARFTGWNNHYPDRAFVANARTDVPRLCAEVRRLRAALAAVCFPAVECEREPADVIECWMCPAPAVDDADYCAKHLRGDQ